MIYATRHDNILVISSASEFTEYEEFRNTLLGDDTVAARQASMVERLTDEKAKGYKLPPLIVEFDDESAYQSFTSKWNVEVIRPNAARERQIEMAERIKSEVEEEDHDRRTLEEIHGLQENDPWDHATEEQKEASKKLAEKMKELRAQGGVTDDSFGGNLTKESKIRVNAVNARQDAEGNITVDSIRATKTTLSVYQIDASSEAIEKALDQLGIPENRVEHVEGGIKILLHSFQVQMFKDEFEKAEETYTITLLDEEIPDLIPVKGVYFRLFVKDQKIADVGELIRAEAEYVYADDVEDGSHYLFSREADAEAAGIAMIKGGYEAKIVGVNQKNQEIVAGEGVKVIDSKAEKEVTDPRPWNERAKEYKKLKKKERQAIIDGIKPDEIIFTVEHRENQNDCVAYFTPLSHFRATKTIYDGPLPIDHLLPERLEKHHEGVYVARRADPHLLVAELCKKGFKESLALRFEVNSSKEDLV